MISPSSWEAHFYYNLSSVVTYHYLVDMNMIFPKSCHSSYDYVQLNDPYHNDAAAIPLAALNAVEWAFSSVMIEVVNSTLQMLPGKYVTRFVVCSQILSKFQEMASAPC